MPKSLRRPCKKCGGKLIPQKSTLRRAHPNQRTCWEWDSVCNNCGMRVVDDWHGVPGGKETVLDFLRTGKF